MATTQMAHWRFTVDDYHRMGEAGLLTEDDRVELVDGEVIQMSPIGGAYIGCVNDLNPPSGATDRRGGGAERAEPCEAQPLL